MLPLGRRFHVRRKGCAHDTTHAIERIVDDVSQPKQPEILPPEASLLLFANDHVPNASARRLSVCPFADAIIPIHAGLRNESKIFCSHSLGRSGGFDLRASSDNIEQQ